MPASSLIFVAIIALWAAYLVPGAIRRHRRTASARQEDRNSEAMRVVVSRGSAASVLPAATGTAAAIGASSRPVLTAGPTPAAPQAVPAGGVSKALHRKGSPARTSVVVTRRRRLVVTALVLAVVGWVVVAAGLAPWWSGAVPTLGLALVIAALTRHGAPAPVPVVAAPSGAAAWTAADVLTPVATTRAARTTVVRPARAAAAPAVASGLPTPRREQPSTAAVAERDWKPVPVPLPTYLLKDRARGAAAPVPAPVVLPVEDDRPTEVIDLREHVRVVNG